MKRVLFVVMVVMLVAASQAALLSWSDTAPVIDGADIANLVGVSADADNVNGGNDSGTYIAGDRPALSQTFTTGSEQQGYQLNAITLQQVTYDNTWWSVDAGWVGWGNFEIKIGTKDGAIFTFTDVEYADMVVTGNAAFDVAGAQNGTGTGWYFTMTLDTPIILAADSSYAFSIFATGPFIETNGDGTTSDNYTGGEAFNASGTDAIDVVGDHVFHLDMAVVPEPATMALLGLGALVLRRKR